MSIPPARPPPAPPGRPLSSISDHEGPSCGPRHSRVHRRRIDVSVPLAWLGRLVQALARLVPAAVGRPTHPAGGSVHAGQASAVVTLKLTVWSRAMASLAVFACWCMLLPEAAVPTSYQKQPAVRVTIDLSRVSAWSAPALVSQAWESWAALFQYPEVLTDDTVTAVASHLAPAVLRVGGITADFVHYATAAADPVRATHTYSAPRGRSAAHHATGGAGGPGFWPTAPLNLTASRFSALRAFAKKTGLALLFDLSELGGRNCSTIRSGCPHRRGQRLRVPTASALASERCFSLRAVAHELTAAASQTPWAASTRA